MYVMKLKALSSPCFLVWSPHASDVNLHRSACTLSFCSLSHTCTLNVLATLSQSAFIHTSSSTKPFWCAVWCLPTEQLWCRSWPLLAHPVFPVCLLTAALPLPEHSLHHYPRHCLVFCSRGGGVPVHGLQKQSFGIGTQAQARRT